MSEEKLHLEKFITTFIAKDRRERWNYILLENPDKADHRELMRFYGHRDEKTTKYIKRDDLPKFLGNDFDRVKGIYFDDLDRVAEFTTVTNALEKGYGREAIFSVKAGELALFFTHEYDIFLCQK